MCEDERDETPTRRSKREGRMKEEKDNMASFGGRGREGGRREGGREGSLYSE